ncbi:septum formation initiator family protein [Patescibacteria group bacterium]
MKVKISSNLKYILGATLLVFLSFGFIKSGLEVLEGSKRLSETQEEVLSLEGKKEALEQEIQYKRTPEYIEEKARNDLNLVKPGETIYIIEKGKEEKGGETSVLSEKDEVLESTYKDTNWYMWYRLFF